jgi:hypothetical protein
LDNPSERKMLTAAAMIPSRVNAGLAGRSRRLGAFSSG